MATSARTNFANIARPYALAAFEFAQDKHQLPAWKTFLESASAIVLQHDVSQLLKNPELSTEKLYDFFDSILTHLDREQKNFLLLLTQNKRLLALPEITDLFNNYYAALQHISTVRVVTAIDVTEEYRQTLAQALANRIKHEVKLHCEVDPSIIGGAVIHIGDRVIDGSVRGKLARLLEFSLR